MKTASTREINELALVFDALGHPRRIAIFLALRAAGSSGLTFGGLAKQANIADPSLSHHIRMMKKSGLVHSNVKGQFTILTLEVSATKLALKRLSLI